jgi:hypothetical protein
MVSSKRVSLLLCLFPSLILRLNLFLDLTLVFKTVANPILMSQFLPRLF